MQSLHPTPLLSESSHKPSTPSQGKPRFNRKEPTTQVNNPFPKLHLNHLSIDSLFPNALLEGSLKHLSTLIILAVSLIGCHRNVNSRINPPPTPSVLVDENREKEFQREAWWASMHKVREGRDWRHVRNDARDNLIRKRNTFNKLNKRTQGFWREIGSENQAGRTMVSAVSHDGNTFYVGSHGGGLWKADISSEPLSLENLDWQPISDGIFGGIYQIIASENDQLLAANERFYFSPDGGQSWMPSEIPGDFFGVQRLFALEPSGRIILATTHGWVWNGNAFDVGTIFYRSENYGASFTKIMERGPNNADIWVSKQTGKIYIASHGEIEVSDDGGLSFTPVSTLPITNTNSMMLTGSEADGLTLYAAIRVERSWRIYRSEIGASSWNFMGSVEDVWGDLRSFSVSPTDPDLLLVGGLHVNRSVDGGKNFNIINHWGDYYQDVANKLHADIPGIQFHDMRDGKEYLLISTDGGTYYSLDGGLTVRNISLKGLNVGQYYDVLTNVRDENEILVGAQDQGYQATNSEITPAPFEQIISGDYGHLVSSDGSHDLVYSVYPGFILISSHDGSEVTCCMYADFPEDPELAWMPVLAADPTDKNVLWLGGSKLYRYERTSPTSNQWAYSPMPHHFPVWEGEIITGIRFAPSDPNRAYVVTSAGRFWYSDDQAQTWHQGADGLPLAHYFYGTAIDVDHGDSDRVVVAGSGFENGSVFLSQDGGRGFEPLGDNSPDSLVLGVAFAKDGSGDIYAASENGPYRYNMAAGTWEFLALQGAPLTTYWAVEALPNRMRFATYGRGVWDYYPQSAAEQVSFLPHYTVRPGWDTEFTLINPGSEDLSVSLTAIDEAGNASAQLDETLVPGGGFSKSVNDLFPSLPESAYSGWIRIATNGETPRGLIKFTAVDAGGTSSLPTMNSAAKQLVFPLIENHDDWQSGTALVNVSQATANLTLVLTDIESGREVNRIERALPGNAKLVTMLPALFEGNVPEKASLKVLSDQDIVGFALSFRDGAATIVAVPAVQKSATEP